MFCPECGKKNEEGAKFCEDCGAKLEPNTKVKEPEPKAPRKSMNKKKKILIGSISAIVIILLIGYFIASNNYKPSKVAEEYFLAIMNKDTNKLYKYLDVKNSDFTSKKVFSQVFKDNDKDKKLVNYSVTKEQKDGLTSTVTIEYTLKGDSKANTIDIDLIKDKNNKMLIFDNWKISNDVTSTVKDYEIRTIKDSKVTLAGLTLDKKYLDKEKSSDYDIYVIPELFIGSYDAKVNLKNSMTLEDEISVNSYGFTNLTNLSISDSEKEKIEKDLPKTIELLYQSAIEKKEFKDIKSNFEYKNAKLDDLEEAYTSFMKYVSSNGLTKLKVKKAEVTSAKVNEDGYLSATVKADYNYSLKYTFLGDEKTKDGDTNDTMYLTFDYADNNYKLIDMSSMATYFSRY